MSPAETAAPQFPPVSYADWRARVESELGDDAPRRLRRESLEGLVVEPLYSSDHLPAGVPLPRFARVPGPWRIWQELPIGAGAAGQAALARERSRDLGGIWLRATDEAADAAALATLLGSVLAGGGVEVVLEHAGEPLAGAALLVAGAQAAGTAPDRLAGCLGCDPLGALARRGRLSGSASEQLVAAARWALDQAPGLRAGLVSTAPYADAGADSTQEIAYALATGAEALRPLLAAGLTAETAASQLLVSITVGRDLYLQVAKLRALRLTWGMLLASLDAPPTALRLHARTAWRTKGLRDPGTDLVRSTLEALAAVLGGCDDLTCAPFLDPQLELALGLPLGSATQLLLREEAGFARLADPAGGSWYVESLTAALARRGWEMFAGIEEHGGMARALAIGAVARQVAEATERRRRALAEGSMPMVGVTMHRPPQPVPLPHRPLDAAGEPTREPPAAPPSIPQLAAEPGSPALFAAAVAAAAGGATLGALASALPPGDAPMRAPVLTAWRDAEPFETAAAAPEVPA